MKIEATHVNQTNNKCVNLYLKLKTVVTKAHFTVHVREMCDLGKWVKATHLQILPRVASGHLCIENKEAA